MSKPNQSKSMKSLRNGRSLRLEGLETRQLLSANMLGAMQNDTAGSEVVSSETSTLDCTEAAMLAAGLLILARTQQKNDKFRPES